jgi:hypothetical protein
MDNKEIAWNIINHSNETKLLNPEEIKDKYQNILKDLNGGDEYYRLADECQTNLYIIMMDYPEFKKRFHELSVDSYNNSAQRLNCWYPDYSRFIRNKNNAY